jgi:hypothetical protein
MIARAVRAYVLLLFVADLLLLATSLILHVSVWLGKLPLRDQANMAILLGSLFFNFAVLCLAKERNVWKNEFSACPAWLRWGAALFGCYGFGVAIVQTLLRSEGPDNSLTISAVPLAFEALSMTVLYSVLWRGSLEAPELRKRAGISFVVVMAVFVLLLANRLG